MQKGIWEYLSSENMACYEDKIWFTEWDNNKVYCYDINIKQCVCFCTISDEQSEGKRLFGALVIQGDFLFLFPFSAEKVYKIHLYTKEMESWKPKDVIERDFENYCQEAKFFSAHCFEKKIFVMPASYPAIIEYQTESGKVVYHKDWIAEIRSVYKSEDDKALFRKTIAVGAKIYAPLCRENAVLIFDMSNNCYEIHEVGDESCRYASICYDGREFWLASRKGSTVVKWDGEANYCILNKKDIQGAEKAEIEYRDIVFWQNHVILLPGNRNNLWEIDRSSKVITELDIKYRNYHYIAVCEYSGRLYFSSVEGKWIVLDKNTDISFLERIGCVFDSKPNLQTEEIYFENEQNSLEDYLLAVIA